MTLYIAAIGIHQFEADAQPEHFGTLGQSLWWAIGLMVDVDYGEIWPVTFGGKAFTAIIALIKAMDYRDRKGTGLQIVHEEDWTRALER